MPFDLTWTLTHVGTRKYPEALMDNNLRCRVKILPVCGLKQKNNRHRLLYPGVFNFDLSLI